MIKYTFPQTLNWIIKNTNIGKAYVYSIMQFFVLNVWLKIHEFARFTNDNRILWFASIHQLLGRRSIHVTRKDAVSIFSFSPVESEWILSGRCKNLRTFANNHRPFFRRIRNERSHNVIRRSHNVDTIIRKVNNLWKVFFRIFIQRIRGK